MMSTVSASLPVIVDTLAALGRARAHGEGRWRAA
jgi:hypothetical protein